MKITITIENEKGRTLSDTYRFEDEVNFPTNSTDMNEEINGMIDTTNEAD